VTISKTKSIIMCRGVIVCSLVYFVWFVLSLVVINFCICAGILQDRVDFVQYSARTLEGHRLAFVNHPVFV